MSDTDPKPPENPPNPYGAPPTQYGPPPAPQSNPYPPYSQPPLSPSEIQSKKLAAGLLGILIGGLGIHKFYLGYQQEGIIMLLVTVLGGGVGTMLTCGLMAPLLMVMPIIGMIEGIMYLTKSDEEFANMYLIGRKPWF